MSAHPDFFWGGCYNSSGRAADETSGEANSPSRQRWQPVMAIIAALPVSTLNSGRKVRYSAAE